MMPCTHDLVEVEIDRVPIRIATKRMGNPNAEWVAFLLPGVLSDSRVWDYMVARLGRERLLILIDLMGQGGSDKPDPADLPADAYSPGCLARQVLQVMRVKLAELDPDIRVAVMGHSLGGMVLLRALGDPELRAEYADVVGRVERVVLLSPVDFAMERVHETFEEIATTPDVAFSIALATGILRQRAADSVFDSTVDPYHIPREEVDRLWEILSNRATRRAAQAMIRNAVPFDDNGRQRWRVSARIESEHGNITAPCLILWGAQDETFGKAMGYKLQRQMRDAWFLAIDDCMHSLPSEKPVRCAQEAITFIRDGGAGRERCVDEAVEREKENGLH